MKITVFGASGKSGQILVERALELGYEVNAYVRRENAISHQDPKLNIIVGNLNEVDKISLALKGADACISTLGGASLKKRAIEVTDGIKLILEQMEKEGVTRFIYLSSLGAGKSRYYMSRLIRFIVVDLLLRIPIADHNLNEEYIMKSELEWTILRPGGLSNEPYTGKYKYGSEKTVFKGNPKISRANVAAFILDQASNNTLMKKAVWLHE